MGDIKIGRYAFWPLLLFFVGFISFFVVFSEILLPFIVGMLFAYMFNPLISRMEKKLNFPRGVSAVSLVLCLFLSVVFLFIILIPYIQNQLKYLILHIPEYIQMIQDQVTKIGTQFSWLLSEQDIIHFKEGVSDAMHGVTNWGVSLLSSLLSKGLVVANILSLIVITPVVAIFFLKDWPKIVRKIEALLPRRYSTTIQQLLNKINQVLGLLVRGQALIVLILMIYYGACLSVLKVEGGLLIGLISGLFSFIPYFAVSFGFVMSMFSGFFSNFDFVQNMVIIGIFVVGGVLEGAVLTPLLIGNSIGLHPLWVVFSVLAGAKIGGFVGVLVAVPVAATLGVLVRFGISKYLESSYYQK